MLGLRIEELIIILVIILLIFGVGRITKVAGELGKSIRSFKDGWQGSKEDPTANSNHDDKGTDNPS